MANATQLQRHVYFYFIFCASVHIYWNNLLLLFRLYSSLQTTTEPHRLTASLECVVCVARALVRGGKHYPEGQTHVIPLLIQTLPGIDPNDIKKCMVRIVLLCWHLFFFALLFRERLCFRYSRPPKMKVLSAAKCLTEAPPPFAVSLFTHSLIHG